MSRSNRRRMLMKILASVLLPLFLLTSCVFDVPFEKSAKFPVQEELLGVWEEQAPQESEQNRLLVLKHSENEYLVAYPFAKKGMVFRAFDVELEGQRYLQVQWIGSDEGPVAESDRKYHLLKVQVDGDELEIAMIAHELLGEKLTTSAELRSAFAEHKDQEGLFGEAVKFKRVKMAHDHE